MIQGAWGWCTGMTHRDGMGREVGGGFSMGSTCTPIVDSCQCMAKPRQYCKVISLQLKKQTNQPSNLTKVFYLDIIKVASFNSLFGGLLFDFQTHKQFLFSKKSIYSCVFVSIFSAKLNLDCLCTRLRVFC